MLSQEQLAVEDARLSFIADTRGGRAFLIAGAAFWLIGALLAQIAPNVRVNWVLYGGLAVPVLGFVIAKLQGARPGTILVMRRWSCSQPSPNWQRYQPCSTFASSIPRRFRASC